METNTKRNEKTKSYGEILKGGEMTKSTWKKTERRVARFFGAERNPLSGGNSKQTRSDSLHKKLFIETKHNKDPTVWKQYKEIEEDIDDIPILILRENNDSREMVCIHKDYFDKIASNEENNIEEKEKTRKSMAIWTLYDKTKDMANAENKITLLAIHKKYKHGFLLCFRSKYFNEIINIYNEEE